MISPMEGNESVWVSVWLPQVCEILTQRPISFSPHPEYWLVNCTAVGWENSSHSPEWNISKDVVPTNCFSDSIRRPAHKLLGMPHQWILPTGPAELCGPLHKHNAQYTFPYHMAGSLCPSRWGQWGKPLHMVRKHMQKVGPPLQDWKKAYKHEHSGFLHLA